MMALRSLIALSVALSGLGGSVLAQERASGADAQMAVKPMPALHPDRVDGGWTLLFEDVASSILISAEQPMETARVWLRFELWPTKGRTGTSLRTLYETDCRKRTIREALNIVYPQSNLHGVATFPTVAGRARKASVRAADSLILQAACDAEARLDSKARTEGRESDLAAAARQNARFKGARAGAWHGLAIKNDVKLYVRGAEPAIYPRLEVRLERLVPITIADQPVLSSQHLIDVDCDAYEYRLAATTVYPRNNLKGKRLELASDIEWKAMERDVFAALGKVCDPRMEGLDALGPLAMKTEAPAGLGRGRQLRSARSLG